MAINRMNNAWSAIIAFTIGASLLIAFYEPIKAMIGTTDDTVTWFLAIIALLVFTYLAFILPISHVTEDDKGNNA